MNNNFTKTKETLEKFYNELNLPYLEIKVYKNYDKLYEYKCEKNTIKGQDSVFFYSCTKVFVSALVMRLVEDGYIDLNDEVSKYLPEFAHNYLLDKDGNKVPSKKVMRLKHLFTMSAGIHVNTKQMNDLGVNGLSSIEAVSKMPKNFPLAFEPGDGYDYGFCLDILSACCEVATKKKLSELLNEYIFKPLNITSFGVNNPKNAEKFIKDLYFNRDGKFEKIPTKNELLYGDIAENAGGCLYGNGDDYCKLATLLTMGGVSKDGYRLLKPETLKVMTTEKIKDMCVNNTFTCVQGGDYSYGYGVRVRVVPTSWGLPVGEFGWDGAAGSYIMMDPINKITIYVGMHIRNWPPIFRGKHLELVKAVYEDLKITK